MGTPPDAITIELAQEVIKLLPENAWMYILENNPRVLLAWESPGGFVYKVRVWADDSIDGEFVEQLMMEELDEADIDASVPVLFEMEGMFEDYLRATNFPTPAKVLATVTNTMINTEKITKDYMLFISDLPNVEPTNSAMVRWCVGDKYIYALASVRPFGTYGDEEYGFRESEEFEDFSYDQGVYDAEDGEMINV